MKHSNYSSISASSSSTVSASADLLQKKAESKLRQKLTDAHKNEAEAWLQIMKTTVSSELFGGGLSIGVVASNKSSEGYCYRIKTGSGGDQHSLISCVLLRIMNTRYYPLVNAYYYPAVNTRYYVIVNARYYGSVNGATIIMSQLHNDM